MIRAEPRPAAASFAARLAARVRDLAAARLAARRAADPWHDPAALWPRFGDR